MSLPRRPSEQDYPLVRPHSPPSAAELYRQWRAQGEGWGRRRCDSLHWAAGVWLILALAVAVRTWVRPTSHTVFPLFAASAEHWWSDQSLYDRYPPLDYFRYPPFFAVFISPFSALGPRFGGVLWSWTSIVVCIAGLCQFVRDVIPSSWTRRRTGIFLMLAALGALRGLWNAQSNALVLGLLLLGAAAMARACKREDRPGAGRRWWLAAFLLAAPVCLKMTPLAPVLLLCVLWPRRLAARLAAAMGVLFLVPFLTRSPEMVLDHYRDWIAHLLQLGNDRWPGFRDGWTVWLVLRHCFGSESGALPLREPMDSVIYRMLQLASAAAVLGWCLWQRRCAVRRRWEWRWLVHVTLSMGLAWLMLFGPAVEHSTYVLLAPPLAWAVLERRVWPQGQGLIGAAFALIMLLGWGAVSRWLGLTQPLLLIALPAGTLLFAMWLIGYAHHQGRQQFGKYYLPP